MVNSRTDETELARRVDGISALEGPWAAAHARALRTMDELAVAERRARELFSPRPPAANPEASGRWREQTEAIRRGLEVPALEAANDAAWRAVGRLAERIEALTARNVLEGAIKLRVVMDYRVDGAAEFEDGSPLRRILADLEQLAGRPALAA